MKKAFLLSMCTIALTATTQAQFLNRLINSANNAAKNAVERQVERKVEEGVDKIFNPETGEYEPVEKENKTAEPKEAKASQTAGWTCPACGTSGNNGKFCNECGAKKPEGDGSWTCSSCGTKGNKGKFCNECGAKKPDGNGAQGAAAKPAVQKVEMAYAKSDFVTGDEIFFEDNLEGEQLGEFPSRWDLWDGNVEVVKVGGVNAIGFIDNASFVRPLMTNLKSYLPEAYTIEVDLYVDPEKRDNNPKYDGGFVGDYYLQVCSENDNNLIEITVPSYVGWDCADGKITPKIWAKGTSKDMTSELPIDLTPGWNHLALSVNKRAVKAYLNGIRFGNIPNFAEGGTQVRFGVHSMQHENAVCQIRNVRIAKGAVPLYNRLATDGKIITYAITFETGKADLKPESMAEIARIAKLMTGDANLNFEVQGHCDATGSDAVNDPLSQKRAEAIVAALVQQGIAANRLTAVGKGSHVPLADNSTDEGRAKNRRVEFVKK